MSADQVEAIHRASLGVLAEIGMRVLGARARDILAAAGAAVDHGEMIVRFEPAMIEEYMAHAPARFTMHARNPERSLEIGGNHITFHPVAGPSFTSDLDKGRRPGSYAEMCDFMRVVQCLDILHFGAMSPFEPLDLPVPTRHLDTGYAGLTLHDKVVGCWLLGGRARARRHRHGAHRPPRGGG